MATSANTDALLGTRPLYASHQADCPAMPGDLPRLHPRPRRSDAGGLDRLAASPRTLPRWRRRELRDVCEEAYLRRHLPRNRQYRLCNPASRAGIQKAGADRPGRGISAGPGQLARVGKLALRRCGRCSPRRLARLGPQGGGGLDRPSAANCCLATRPGRRSTSRAEADWPIRRHEQRRGFTELSPRDCSPSIPHFPAILT